MRSLLLILQVSFCKAVDKTDGTTEREPAIAAADNFTMNVLDNKTVNDVSNRPINSLRMLYINSFANQKETKSRLSRDVTAQSKGNPCKPNLDKNKPNSDKDKPNSDKDKANSDKDKSNSDKGKPNLDNDKPYADKDKPNSDKDKSDLDKDKPNSDNDKPYADKDKPNSDKDKSDLDKDKPNSDKDKPNSDKDKPNSDKDNQLRPGGPWTVLQRRFHGHMSFNGDWNRYKIGFGNLEDEFWLGLKHIYALTNAERHELRIILRNWDDTVYYANYDYFLISNEESNYELMSLGAYSGNASDAFSKHHGGAMFSTKDRDNDGSDKNCAKDFKSGWWFTDCFNVNLNGEYPSEDERFAKMGLGISWFGIQNNSFKASTMIMRPVR